MTCLFTQHNEMAKMLRVNHAGEYGATYIYKGQCATTTDPDQQALLKHMLAQEEEHLAAFSGWVQEQSVQPTLLLPFWRAGGWLMGAVTALMGKEAAMACTMAVEEVIDAHYADQEECLAAYPASSSMNTLKQLISKCRAEEQEHHQIAVENDGPLAPFYPVLTGTIAGICRLAIRLSKEI